MRFLKIFIVATLALLVTTSLNAQVATARAKCTEQIQKIDSSVVPDRDLVNLCERVLSSDPTVTAINISADSVPELHSEIARLTDYESPDVVPTPGFCQSLSDTPAAVPADSISTLFKVLSQLSDELPTGTLSLTNFAVIGDLKIDNLDVPFGVALSNVVFCGSVLMRSVTAAQNFSFKNAVVLYGGEDASEGVFNAMGATFPKGFHFESSRAGAVLLAPTGVQPTLSLTESTLGFLLLGNVKADLVALKNLTQSAGVADRLKPPGSDDEVAKRLEELVGPFPYQIVGNYIYFSDAVVSGEVQADDMRADGNLAMHLSRMQNLRLQFAELGGLDLRGARIVGDANFSGSILGRSLLPGAETPANAQDCVYDRFSYADFRGVTLLGAKIGGSVVFRNEKEGATVRRARADTPMCLSLIEVGESLDISGLDAYDLILRDASINGALLLHSRDQEGFKATRNSAILDLSASQIGALRMSEKAPLPSKTVFRGTQIADVRLEVRTSRNSNAPPTVLDETLVLTSILDDVDFHSSGRETYRVFREVYSNLGYKQSANVIALAEERQVTAHTSNPLTWLLRIVRSAFGGYGFRPELTVLWAMAFTVFGAVILHSSGEGRQFLKCQQTAWRTQKTAWDVFNAIVFSFDRLIPIVSINSDHGKLQFQSEPWTRCYFVFHTIFGWLLASAVLVFISESLGLKSSL